MRLHWAVCVVCVVRDADGWVGVQAKRSVVAVSGPVCGGFGDSG